MFVVNNEKSWFCSASLDPIRYWCYLNSACFKKSMIWIRSFVDLICTRCVLTVLGQCEERVHCASTSILYLCLSSPELRAPFPHIFFGMTFNVKVWTCLWRRRCWLALTSGLVRLLPFFDFRFGPTLTVLWLQVWTCPWRRRSWPNSYPCFDFRFGFVRLLPFFDFRFGPARDEGGADRTLILALTSGLDLFDSYPCFDFRFGPVRDEGRADRALLTVRQAGGRSARHLPQWTLQGKNV